MNLYLKHIVAVLLSSISPAFLIAVYFLLFSVIGDSLGSLFKELPVIFLLVSSVAFLHALFLGLPTYLIVRAYSKFTYTIAALCGFLIGALPSSIYNWPYSDIRSSATINGVETVINGVPTSAGWLMYLKGVLVFGFLGMAAGLVFKRVVSEPRASDKQLKMDGLQPPFK